MKTRNGFVSNSSTSSFICQICGGVEAGMDLCLEEAEMIRCKNGHEIHVGCAGEYTDKINEYLEDEDEEEGSRYDVNPSVCPICQFKELREEDELYIRRLENPESEESILNRMKEKYKTYEAFKEEKDKKGEKE